MKAFFQSLFFASLILPSAASSADQYCQRAFVDTSLANARVGPLKLRLASDNLSLFRSRKDLFYNTSKKFVETVGRPFVDLVRSRIPSKGRVDVIIAMGGAEHLGTLLEYSLVAQKVEGVDIRIHYIEMNSQILNPWEASKDNKPDGKLIIRKGVGPPPDGYRLLSNPSDRGRFGRHFSPIFEKERIYDSDKIIVVDTGFRGTSAEAVAYITESFEFDGPIEGVLLCHSKGTENTVPIFAVNRSLGFEDQITESWAFSIDENVSYGDRLVEGHNKIFTFYRSSKLNNAHHAYSEREQKYLSTLAGLIDGLSSAPQK